MSEWGTEITALEAHWRTADGTIPAGDLGFERGVGNGEDLPASRLPHVFAFEPVEGSEEIGWSQERRTRRYLFDYWRRGATQEAVALVLDAFEAAIDGDRTLGGAVVKARVAGRELLESNTGEAASAGLVVRLARVEVETVVED